MAPSRPFLIALGAICVAVATGLAMQATAPHGFGLAGLTARAPSGPALAAPPVAEPRLVITGITLTSALGTEPPTSARVFAAPMEAPARPELAATGDTDPIHARCPVALRADPGTAALAVLTFQAPCAPYARVTFEHEGLRFAEETDSTGRIEIAVPALVEYARFTATLDDGASAAAELQVASLVFYDRAVLQSAGDAGLSLHAMEVATDKRGPAHVWSGAPRNAAVAARGEGGFFLLLGDPGLPGAELVEVYTFPAAVARHAGEVVLSVEAEATSATCGTPVEASILQVRGAVRAIAQQVRVAMPGCEAPGDLQRLKTPFDDLKIASR